MVPKHEVVQQGKEESILKEYGIDKRHLPKILKSDPALSVIKPERGNIIKITRNSETAGVSVYYRVVV